MLLHSYYIQDANRWIKAWYTKIELYTSTKHALRSETDDTPTSRANSWQHGTPSAAAQPAGSTENVRVSKSSYLQAINIKIHNSVQIHSSREEKGFDQANLHQNPQVRTSWIPLAVPKLTNQVSSKSDAPTSSTSWNTNSRRWSSAKQHLSLNISIPMSKLT